MDSIPMSRSSVPHCEISRAPPWQPPWSAVLSATVSNHLPQSVPGPDPRFVQVDARSKSAILRNCSPDQHLALFFLKSSGWPSRLPLLFRSDNSITLCLIAVAYFFGWFECFVITISMCCASSLQISCTSISRVDHRKSKITCTYTKIFRSRPYKNKKAKPTAMVYA